MNRSALMSEMARALARVTTLGLALLLLASCSTESNLEARLILEIKWDAGTLSEKFTSTELNDHAKFRVRFRKNKGEDSDHYPFEEDPKQPHRFENAGDFATRTAAIELPKWKTRGDTGTLTVELVIDSNGVVETIAVGEATITRLAPAVLKVTLTAPDPCDPPCGEGETCVDGDCVAPTTTSDPSCDPTCGEGETCVDGTCVAESVAADCDPVCEDGFNCVDGECECQPQCDEKFCGSDGCGGDCGPCPTAVPHCTESGQCVEQPCEPSECQGKLCSEINSCGDHCATVVCADGDVDTFEHCFDQWTDVEGHENGCFTAAEACAHAGRECGEVLAMEMVEGAGVSCGGCDGDLVCSDEGQCVTAPCDPECGENEICVDSQCEDTICVPDETFCTNDHGITQVCNALGTGPAEGDVPAPCGANEKCDMGEDGAYGCQPMVCTPNVGTCSADNATVLTCNDLGTGTTEEPGTSCDEDFICDATFGDTGTYIEDACVSVVCVADKAECDADNKVVLTCNALGTGHLPETENCADLGSAGACVAQGVTAFCECLKTCEAATDDITPCGDDGCGDICGTCQGTDECSNKGACMPVICVPGQPLCSEDNLTVLQCNGLGIGPQEAPAEVCLEDFVCDGGACKEKLCPPDSNYCKLDESETSFSLLCNSLGTGPVGDPKPCSAEGEPNPCMKYGCDDQDGGTGQCSEIPVDDGEACGEAEVCVDDACTPVLEPCQEDKDAIFCDGLHDIAKCVAFGTAQAPDEPNPSCLPPKQCVDEDDQGQAIDPICQEPPCVPTCDGKSCDKDDGCGQLCVDLCDTEEFCFPAEQPVLGGSKDSLAPLGGVPADFDYKCLPVEEACDIQELLFGKCGTATSADEQKHDCPADVCGEFAVCDDELCAALECEPLAQFCGADGAVHTCDDDGLGSTVADECDGPGEECVDTPPDPFSTDGKCICVPQCDGKECGPDGCGGVCDVCGVGDDCVNGNCEACVPVCDQVDCGQDDTCGGACGCANDYTCNGGTCEADTPECDPTDCDDGYACTTDSCVDGACDNTSQAGSCVIESACQADGDLNGANECLMCDSAENASAWTYVADDTPCAGGTCQAGSCDVDECIPGCQGGTCGDDGCGGSCECKLDEICVEDFCEFAGGCEPNTYGCDEHFMVMCNQWGDSYSMVHDCWSEGGGTCEMDEGGMMSNCICTPGVAYCDGNTVRHCHEDGYPLWEEDPENCSTNMGNNYCIEGQCETHPYDCPESYEGVCEEGVSLHCGASLDIDYVDDCAADGLDCDVVEVGDGTSWSHCTCVPGALYCSGTTTLEQCDQWGTGPADPDQAYQECGDLGAICMEGECAPLGGLKPPMEEIPCNNAGGYVCDGNLSFGCSASGFIDLFNEPMDCAFEGQICVDGACQNGQTVCEPNAVYCDGNNQAQCNDQGTANTYSDPCPGDTVCSQSEPGAMPTCIAGGDGDPCEPGPVCAGDVLTVCNASGTGPDLESPMAVDCTLNNKICGIDEEGKSDCLACHPTKLFCAGSTVLQCDNFGDVPLPDPYMECGVGEVCYQSDPDAMPTCIDDGDSCDGLECGYCEGEWLWTCAPDPAEQNGCVTEDEFWCDAGVCTTHQYNPTWFPNNCFVEDTNAESYLGEIACNFLCIPLSQFCGYVSPTQEQYDELGQLLWDEYKVGGPHDGARGIWPLTPADSCACGSGGGACDVGETCQDNGFMISCQEDE